MAKLQSDGYEQNFWAWIFYLKRQGYTDITRVKIIRTENDEKQKAILKSHLVAQNSKTRWKLIKYKQIWASIVV